MDEKLIEILHTYLTEVNEGTDKSDTVYVNQIKKLFDDWIKIEDDLPEINEPVIVFYQIPGTARKYYDHIEIGKLKSIIIGKDYPITQWWDLYQNVIVPTHWLPCPEPPK